MLKFFKLFAFSLLLQASAGAAELGTAPEAIAMVNKALAYLAENGRDKTLAEVNNKTGIFVDRDLYVVAHDMKGVVLANAVLPRMVGKDLSETRDVDGKYFMRERLAILAKAPSGWIEFKWPNSVTQKVDVRSVYFARAGDIVFTCGIVKK